MTAPISSFDAARPTVDDGLKRRMLAGTFCLAIAMASLTLTTAAEGHSVSTAYLRLATSAAQPTLRVDVPLRDLEDLVGMDGDGDGRLTWREVNAASSKVASRIASNLDLRRAGQSCDLHAAPIAIDMHAGTPHGSVEYEVRCPSTGAWSLYYTLLFDRDRTHRALLAIEGDDAPIAVILEVDRHGWQESEGRWTRFLEFLRQGVWHIWLGYDHLAFLLLLLLPAALGPSQTRSSPSVRAIMLRVLRIVTAFTVAHSLTLTLATLSVLAPPAAPIEAAIAATVIATGVINLFPRLAVHGAGLAFAFGLIHGFGFANALSELGLSRGAVLAPLAGFNLGVEAGQLGAVALAMPLLAILRTRALYGRWVVPGLSISIAVLAVGWLLQRLGLIALVG